MKQARKFLSLMMAAFLMLSLLPATGVSATGNNGQYWFPDNTVTDGEFVIWDEPHCPHCGGSEYDPAGDGRVERQPTCTEPGSIYYGYCSNCGEVRDVIPPLGHDWGTLHHEYDGDCTKPGMDWHECARCGYLGYQYADYGDHRWGEWEVIQYPTPQEDGYEERECEICHLTERRPLTAEGEFSMSLFKSVYNTPKNGLFYVEGEEVQYLLEVRNNADAELSDVFVYDLLLGEGEDSCVRYEEMLEARGGLQVIVSYTVTAQDVARTYIVNQATARGRFYTADGYLDVEQESGDVIVRTGTMQDTEFPGMNVAKRVVSSPANGIYYSAGEQIEFMVEAQVEADVPLSGLLLVDPLCPDGPRILNAGESATLDYFYTVTEEEAEIGFVTNTAYIQWMTDAGGMQVSSNTVKVPTSMDGAEELGMLASAVLIKSVSSTPSFGEAYVIGETIRYDVTLVNTGHVSFDTVDIMDPLCGMPYSMSTYENVQPGQSVTVDFSYIVTEDDALAGMVTNTANASCVYGEKFISVLSNTVTLPVEQDGLEWSNTSACYYIELNKEIWSTPANGLYYVEGEAIDFIFVGEISKNAPRTVYSLSDPLFAYTFAGGVLYSPLKPGSIIDIGFSYVVTAEDVANHIVSNTAYIKYINEYGNVCAYPSNTVYAPTSPEGAEALKAVTGLVVEKQVVNTPKDGVRFTPWEEIVYEITVSNPSAFTFTDVYVYDGLEADPLGYVPQMAPGYTNSWTYRYLVSEQDAVARRVENIAKATCIDAQGQTKEYWSSTVIVPIYNGALTLTMDVIGLPANGSFYVPGETVRYQIEGYNPSDMTAYQVTGQCYLDEVALMDVDEIAPGFACYWQASHVVTEADAVLGWIWNYAFIDATLGNGAAIFAVSDGVEVAAGFEGDTAQPPFGVISEMDITKDFISNPANGYAYTEGETITYTITIENCGETTLGEALVFDPLYSITHELGSAEHLYPGDKRTYTFSYTVTAEDVRYGCVMNTAYVTYDNAGYLESRISNTVCCMTKGDGTPVPPVAIELPGEGNGMDYCRPELKNAGDFGMEFESGFCAVHNQTREFIDTMLTGADDEAMRERVWVYARQMWKDDLDTMYDSLLKAAPPAAKAIVLNERIQFNALFGSTEAALNALYPDQPELVAKKIADMLMCKAVELCYEMHTAPEARVDSFSHPHGTAASNADKQCVCTDELLSDGTLRSLYAICPAHGVTWQMGNKMQKAAKTAEEGWQKAAKLWQMELKMSNQQLWAGLDDKAKAAMKTELQVFLNWLDAREALLNTLYPKNPSTVQEVLVQAMIEHTMEYCAIKN